MIKVKGSVVAEDEGDSLSKFGAGAFQECKTEPEAGFGFTKTQIEIFQDAVYKGLYNGRSAKGIAARKNIPEGEILWDRMGYAELAANDFCATQAAERFKREPIQDLQKAIVAHNQVGQAARQAILDQGNTPPEDLPIEANIKLILEKRKREEAKSLPAPDTDEE
jgi:hypothetical protein